MPPEQRTAHSPWQFAQVPVRVVLMVVALMEMDMGNSKRGLRKKTYWFLNQFSFRHVMNLVWPGLFFFLFAKGWI
jgi:hypothetical protein